MSAPVLRSSTSAGRPASTAAACADEPPYEALKDTSFPSGLAWKSEMIFVITGLGVEYATRFSVVDLVVAPATATTARPATIAVTRASLVRFISTPSPSLSTGSVDK